MVSFRDKVTHKDMEKIKQFAWSHDIPDNQKKYLIILISFWFRNHHKNISFSDYMGNCVEARKTQAIDGGPFCGMDIDLFKELFPLTTKKRHILDNYTDYMEEGF